MTVTPSRGTWGSLFPEGAEQGLKGKEKKGGKNIEREENEDCPLRGFVGLFIIATLILCLARYFVLLLLSPSLFYAFVVFICDSLSIYHS